MSAAFDLDADLVELAPYVPSVGEAHPLGEAAWRSNAWTSDEVARLRRMFAADDDLQAICEALGRPRGGVTSKLWELGLRRRSTRPWSELEDGELVRRYGAEPAARLAQDLGRATSAVYARAQTLGLSEANAPAWDPWEDAQLRAGYEAGLPIDQVCAIVGRTPCAVNTRASKLGVRHANGSPDWSDAETSRLLELAEEGHRYLKIAEIMAAEGFPERTKAGIQPQLRKLGYGRGWGRPWTSEEEDLLRAAYRDGLSVKQLMSRLGRTVHASKWKANQLGLTGTHVRKDGWRGRVWTEEENARLRDAYGKVPNRQLARELDRKWEAVRVQAARLGVSHGWMRAFTADEDEAIQIAWRLGLSIPALAEAMQRDTAVVAKHAVRIGFVFSDPNRPARPRRGAIRAPRYSLAEILAMGDRASVDAASPAPAAAPESSRRTAAAPAASELGTLLSSMSDRTAAMVLERSVGWVRDRRAALARKLDQEAA